MLANFAALAQFERDRIAERTRTSRADCAQKAEQAAASLRTTPHWPRGNDA